MGREGEGGEKGGREEGLGKIGREGGKVGEKEGGMARREGEREERERNTYHVFNYNSLTIRASANILSLSVDC